MIFNLTKHIRVEKNTLGTDYLVGDVHGHYDDLMFELKRVRFNKATDRLFLLGDICNKGDNSIDCIKLLVNPEYQTFTVEGNHEAMVRLCITDDDFYRALSHPEVGGEWALDCLRNEPTKFKFLCAILYSKCYNAITLETKCGSIGLMHAQAPDDWNVLSENSEELDSILQQGLWSRGKINSPLDELSPVKNIDFTVHGHANVDKVTIKHNMMWIDTLFNGGRLTLMSVEQAYDLIAKT